jgi:L-threonylcarbamoyladenylate synthase
MAEIGKDIAKASQLLMAGELVAIPTETVYGLAGNALNPASIAKIFSVKNRPSFDPLIVHVESLTKASECVTEIPDVAKKLIDRFWPGPLTLLLKKSKKISDLVTSGMDTVGIRCPNHPMTLALLSQLDFPLAAPSANPFGYVSPTTPAHVNEQLGNKIHYILDGGSCEVGIESTVLGFEKGKPVIYRFGGLSQEKIEAVIGKVGSKIQSTSNPKSPGQLISHYAPTKRVILGNLTELVKTYATQAPGILAFQKTVMEADPKHQLVLSPTGDLEEAAQNLFSALRELDKMKIDLILAEEVPDMGLGKAINDRLRRAAKNKV